MLRLHYDTKHVYFQLAQGILIKVFPSLINRRKNHFHNLPCGISVIIGNNGFIWISPQPQEMAAAAGEKDEIEIYDAQVSKSKTDTEIRKKKNESSPTS